MLFGLVWIVFGLVWIVFGLVWIVFGLVWIPLYGVAGLWLALVDVAHILGPLIPQGLAL